MDENVATILESQEGLTSNPILDPAAKLLMEAIIPNGNLLLLIEGGCGRLAAHFAPQFKKTIQHNIFYQNHMVSQQFLAAQHLNQVHCLLSDIPRVGGDTGLEPNSCDEIIFRLGRGTTLVNAALTESFELLKMGGHLWVSGHAQEGIKSFAKRAEAHFGNMQLLKIKSSCRLFCFKKESTQPITPLLDPKYFDYVELTLDLPKLGPLNYSSKPGIFSYRSTDIGTALLAKHLPDCKGKSVLDLGCGSGVLSLAAAKLGAEFVLAVDTNEVATQCATRNFEIQKVNGKSICTHLTNKIEETFDIVFTNPPFHEGHKTDYSFPGKILDAILPRLNPGGSAYLVANQFLDYASQGSTRFTKVEILEKNEGYCVYRMDK